MEQQNNSKSLLDLIKSFHLPEWLTNNVITALGKGINDLLVEVMDIPKHRLHNYNERTKLIGEIQREYIRKAASLPLTKIEQEPDLAARALKNMGLKFLEEQLNKESVAVKAIEEIKSLKIPGKCGPEKLSHDWLTAFWNLAGTRSEDEIHEILSKILANEIVFPGSLSLHTLQTLSILDSKVGNAFARLCNLSIDDGSTAFVIHPHVFEFQNVGLLDDYGISFTDLLYLDGANLIRSAETILLQFSPSDNESGYDYDNVDYASLPAKLSVSGRGWHILYFTQAGRELRRLLQLKPNELYTKVLVEQYGNNFKLTGND